MKNKMKFSGEKLKAKREELKLSVNDVVARLREMGHKEASTQLLYNYEKGENVPGMDYGLSLASIYKCSIHCFANKGE